MSRANYSSKVDEKLWGRLVSIIDHDEGMSVTNDAETVVEEVIARYGLNSNDRIIYRDTEGDWDQLTHDGRHFKGFYSLGGCKQWEEAVNRTVEN